MKDTLELEFIYSGNLADKGREVDPRIHFWTSTNRSGRNGEQIVAVKWKDEENQISEKQTVSVPLVNTKKLRRDDTLRFEAIVQSKSEEGHYIGVRAGSNGFALAELYDTLSSAAEEGKKDVIYEKRLDLALPYVVIENEEYSKGELYVRFAGTPSKVLENWEFTREIDPYELIEENRERIHKFLKSSVEISMFPYEQYAASRGYEFKPTTGSIADIHAPLWNNVVKTPGFAYTVNYTDYDPVEEVMSNVARISLERNRVSRDWFIKTVDEQFERGINSKTYNDDFSLAVAYTVSAFALISVSLFYRGDKAFVRLEKGGIMDEVPIEAFNDAYRLLGGDCEDLANLIHRVSRQIEWGKKHLSNSKVPWMKRGGWNDKVLQRMQRIAHIYVGFASLGSVTAQKLEKESYEEDEGGDHVSHSPLKYHPLIIDSAVDVSATIGGHMWWEWIPVAKCEQLINKTNPENKISLYPDETRQPWENELPHLVGEGTGSLFPLLLPLKDYYKDGAMKEEAEFKHRRKLLAHKNVVSNSQYLKVAQIEQYPKLTSNLANARLSGFYRRTGSIYTDKFMNEGYGINEFVWANLSDTLEGEYDNEGGYGYNGNNANYNKNFIEGSTPTNDETKWTWGVNMRYKLLSDRKKKVLAEESKSSQKVGLITVPGLFDEERKTVSSLLRQLPPQVTPDLDSKFKSAIEKKASPYIERFNKLSKEVTANRKTPTNPKDSEHINLIFRGGGFFLGRIEGYGTLRKGLLKDIKENESIYDTETTLEIIADNVYNVRVTLFIDMQRTLSSRAKNVKHRHSIKSAYYEERTLPESHEDDELEHLNVNTAFSSSVY